MEGMASEAATQSELANLEFEFSYRAHLRPALTIGAGPHGQRMFVEAVGGEATGERISGRLSTGGGDWLLIGSDGWGTLDVRAQLITDDDAAIYISYHGHLELTERVQTVLGGQGSVDYGDQYFRSAPRLETGDPRYAWVNRTLFVGVGRAEWPEGAEGPTVEYRVYRVT